MPNHFYTGLTYGDHNIDNYLWENGVLKLIDFGSFVEGDIIDIHLCSSLFFSKIDLEKFKDNYKKSVEDQIFLFDHKDVFKRLQY